NANTAAMLSTLPASDRASLQTTLAQVDSVTAALGRAVAANERHLASMSAEERRSPAYVSSTPGPAGTPALADASDADALAVVELNRALFDRTLSRDAPQVIT